MNEHDDLVARLAGAARQPVDPMPADAVDRLEQRRDASALAWMWGANGGAGVLASIAAVIVSMTFGIETNLLVAGAAYATLPMLARATSPPAPA